MQYLKTINFPEFVKMSEKVKTELEADRSLIIGDDKQKKTIKTERAQLNSTLKEFKSNASQVREKVIGEFNAKVKDITDTLDAHQKLLAQKVSDYNQAWIDSRRDFISKAISSRLTDDIDFVRFDQLNDSRYLNETTTEKKIITDLDYKVSNIKTDYQVAQTISAQVAEIFKQTLDVAKAIEIDKQQQEEQARREAVAKAEAERLERERLEALERQKERDREAMIQVELDEARENGEVIDAERVREAAAVADGYAQKEAVKVISFTVKFEYKDSDYPMAWEDPSSDVNERLQGLKNLEVTQNG